MIYSSQLKFKFFLIMLVFCNSFIGVSKELHVSKSGNDSNSGTKSAPYLTIDKAAQEANAGDVVIIYAGTYFETLKPKNSGNAGSPIIFKANEGDKVIISAMQSLANWELDSGTIYKTKVDWDLKDYNMFMNNNTVMDLARWPNNTDQDPFTLNSVRSEGGSNSSVLNNAYLLNKTIPNVDWKGGNIMFYGDRSGSGWTTWREFITAGSSGRVDFTVNKRDSWIIAAHPPSDGGDFFLEGVKGILDYQNEWWFNSETQTVYAQIEDGKKPENDQIKMRRRQMTIDLNNRNYVEVQGLAVLGGRIEIGGDGNRIYKVSSFHGDYYRGVAQSFIADCRSVYVKWDAKGNKIEQCEIAYGAGSGIYDTGRNTEIKNNYIHDFDFIGDYNAPVLSRGVSGCLISRNVIKNGGRDAIQIITKKSTVEYNDVSRSNLVADDCALIYTIGDNLDMEIHHNWFHDAESRGNKSKAAGIYLDNDAGNVNVYRNVVWNTEWTSLQINWNGTNINAYNNSFAKNVATMGAWHKDGTKFTNVNVWNNITDREAGDAGGQEDEATWEPQSDKQNNLVDKGSYVDWENNDYHLKPNAKAVDFGRIITGYTEGFKGVNPDAGAYELGDDWVPGINWDIQKGPSNNGCYGLPGEACAVAYHVIPGIIEAEAYANQNGIQIEPSLDINGGSNIGFIGNNDFVEYDVNVQESKTYSFGLRVASETNGGSIVFLSGNTVLGNANVSNTGGWQQWVTITVDIPLVVGKQKLKLKFEGTDGFLFNLNWMEIKSSGDLTIINPSLSTENFQSLKVEVFPNPTSEFLIIQTKQQNINLALYDLSGKLILENLLLKNENKLDISNLDNGVYLLKDQKSGTSVKVVKK